MKHQHGFTILELMMSIAVGAILVAVGVPSFVNTIRNSEMTSATNTMVGALYAGRSEAVKRRARITMCRATSSAGAEPQCDSGGMHIAVFLNTANDMTVDTGSGDVVIQNLNWLPDTIDVTSADLPDGFSFNASGFTRAIGGGTVSGDLLFCGPRGNEGARVLTIGPTGRPMVRLRNDVTGAGSCPS